MLNNAGLEDCVKALAAAGMFETIFIEFQGDGYIVPDETTQRTRSYMRYEDVKSASLPVDSISVDGTVLTASVAVTAATIPEGCVMKMATLVTRDGNPLCTVAVDGGSVAEGTSAVLNIKVNFGD